MDIRVFSIFGVLIMAAVYWAGTKGLIGKAVSTVTGG